MKTLYALLAASLLLTAPVVFAQGTTVTLPNPLGSGIGSISALLNMIIDGLIIFAAPVVVLVVIYAGYLLLTTSEDPDRVTQAKNTILYAVVGYGIILIAKGIGLIIQSFFS